MSIRAMSLVWDTDLPSTEKFLLLALADWAAHDGSSIFPSQHRMARKIGVTDRAIRNVLGRLKARGVLVEIEPYHSRAPAQYRINMAALSALTRPDPDDTDRNNVLVELDTSLPPPRGEQGSSLPPPRVEPCSTNPSVVEASVSVEASVRRQVSPKSRIKFIPTTGRIEGIEEEDLARWATLYPAVDLTRATAEAAEWLLNHPERRRSNVAQFLSRWFSKDQDDVARGRKVASVNGGPPKRAEPWFGAPTIRSSDTPDPPVYQGKAFQRWHPP